MRDSSSKPWLSSSADWIDAAWSLVKIQAGKARKPHFAPVAAEKLLEPGFGSWVPVALECSPAFRRS